MAPGFPALAANKPDDYKHEGEKENK